MSFKLLSAKENQLLQRKEIKAELIFVGATPKYNVVAKTIASEMKTSEENVSINHIYTAFGNSIATIDAHIYNSADAKAKFAPKVKVKEAKKEEAK